MRCCQNVIFEHTVVKLTWSIVGKFPWAWNLTYRFSSRNLCPQQWRSQICLLFGLQAYVGNKIQSIFLGNIPWEEREWIWMVPCQIIDSFFILSYTLSENYRKCLIPYCDFGELLKTQNLLSISVTRQFNFNRTKNWWKCQNWKAQMRHF